MKTYHPVSENLNASEPVNGGEAEGNCVAVRRGGEKPEAKEQSQITVNSIRRQCAASLLVDSEACAKREPSIRDRPANGNEGAHWCGWSENAPKEICESGEICMERTLSREESL